MEEREEKEQKDKKEENQQKENYEKLIEKSIDEYNRKYRFLIDIKEIETNYEIALGDIEIDDIRVPDRPYKEGYDFLERNLISSGLDSLILGLTRGISFFPLFGIYMFSFIFNTYIQIKNSEKKYNFQNLVDCRKLEEKFYDKIIKKIKENLNLEYENKFCLLSKCFRFENKLENSIKDILDIYINFNAFENFQNYYNVLVLGRTSVGKSTLIKSILELEPKDEVEVGFDRPTTMKRRVYFNKNNKKN